MRQFTVLALFLLIVGCSGGDGVVKYDITGTITLDGKPVDGAAVVLQTQAGAIESAMTDSSGKFKMSAKAGLAQVGVAKTTYTGGPEGSANFDSPARPEEGGAPSKAKVTYHVAEKYNSPEKSGLSVTVPEGGGDVGEIKVTSK
jgi:hypothetical protein